MSIRLTGKEIIDFKKQHNLGIMYSFPLVAYNMDGLKDIYFSEEDSSSSISENEAIDNLSLSERFKIKLSISTTSNEDSDYEKFLESHTEERQHFAYSKIEKLKKNIPMWAILKKTKEIQNEGTRRIKKILKDYEDFEDHLKNNKPVISTLVLIDKQYDIGDIFILDDKSSKKTELIVSKVNVTISKIREKEYRANLEYIVYEQGYETQAMSVIYNDLRNDYVMSSNNFKDIYAVCPKN